MATKTFKTVFELAAKYTGGAAFGTLNKDLDRTQRNVKQTGTSFHKVFGAGGAVIGALAASAAAYISFRKIVDFGKWAFEAAKEQKKAHDIVRQSNQRLIKEGRLNANELDKQTQATIALAEAMNKAGGLDAETLEVGLAGLNKYLTSEQIDKMAKGWQDWMVKIHKGAPTMEEAAQDVDNLNRYIQNGKKAFLTSIGLTKEQASAIDKQVKGHTAAERAQSRAAAVAKVLGIETGEMGRWAETTDGKLYRMNNTLEDLGEIAGGPAAEAQGELAVAMTSLYESLKPVAELIAKEMTPAIQELSKWITAHKEDIVAWGETAVIWATKVVNFFWWLQAQSEAALKPVWENTKKELNFLIGVWENVKLGAIASWNGIKEIWDLATPYFEKLVEIIKKLFEPLYWWIIKPFKDAYDYIIKLFPNMAVNANASQPSTGGSGGARTAEDYVAPWQQTEATRAKPPAGAEREYAPGIGPVPKGGTTTTGGPVGQGVLGGVLAGKEKVFEEAGKRHGVDPNLLMAIAEFETGHGKSFSARTRNNIAGIMNPKNPSQHMVYKSIDEGIEAQASLLGRKYVSKGLKTIPQIGAVYSPPGASNDPNRTNAEWPSSVQREYNRIQKAGEQATKVVKETADPQHPLGKPPGGTGVTFSGQNLPVPAPPPKPLIFPKTSSLVPAGSSLKDVVKDINMKQRMNATGPTNVAMNAPITVNGVPTGKEYAVARATQKAIQQPIRQTLDEMKSAKKFEDRLTYV